MATTKKKVTRQQYETAIQGYVQNCNQVGALSAKRDNEVLKLDNKYDPQFKVMNDDIQKNFDVVMQYCEENRKQVFGEAKSIDEFGAKMAFKEGNPKVELAVPTEGMTAEQIKEAWTFVVEVLEKKLPAYVRTEKAVAKAKLLEDAETPEVKKNLDKCGLKIIQEESFSIKVIKTNKAKK